MNHSQTTSRKIAAIILKIVIGAVLLGLMLCPIFHIHLFTLGLAGDSADRVDCIEDYYVAVYHNDVCYYSENGEDVLAFGRLDDVTDFDWKHRELLGIAPYRRFLCFSKETEAELYYLTDEAGTVRYGLMYVLRTDSGKLHYYFRRNNPDSSLTFSPILYREEITFSCNGTRYELKDFSRFTADTDFTKNDPVLRICDEPCYFKALER